MTRKLRSRNRRKALMISPKVNRKGTFLSLKIRKEAFEVLVAILVNRVMVDRSIRTRRMLFRKIVR